MTMSGEPGRVVAVDLGSNSFHMVIAHIVNGEPTVVDRIREPVRFAAGLQKDRSLDESAQDRALACLARFAQRLRGSSQIQVRAVGTNTLREAKNSHDFLEVAEQTLGWPIEIIAGEEEARLIHLGVSHSLGGLRGRHLVVDIGGGSTECILGRRFMAVETHSLGMGCVSWTQAFFPKGVVTKKTFEAAVLAARNELVSIRERFLHAGWEEAVGASGTIRSTEAILRQNGWAEEGITLEGLEKLSQQIVAQGGAAAFVAQGLKANRCDVYAGGVAILRAIFQSLKIPVMRVARGALREGLIYDMLGRLRHEDVRERTIRFCEERHNVDQEQAARVEKSALSFHLKVARTWQLDSAEIENTLSWAARLHEVGLAVSWSHHHRHAAYLVAQSTLPGFSRDDQQMLATIVGLQRRRFKTQVIDELPKRLRRTTRRLTILLRLSVLIHRGRSQESPPNFGLRLAQDGLVLILPRDFATTYPLTYLDLKQEVDYLRGIEGGLCLDEVS